MEKLTINKGIIALKPIQDPRADDEIVEACGRTSRKVAAFDIDFNSEIGQRLDAKTAGTTVNKVVAGDSVAAESFVADETVEIGVKQLALIIDRGKNTVCDIVIGIEKAAAALLMKLEQAKTM